FPKALPLAESARQQEPEWDGAWFLAGLCHANLSEFREAVRCFDVCLALKPGRVLAHHHRGRAYLGQARYAEAAADFDRVRGDRPGQFSALVNRASAREGRKDDRGALSHLDKALT